MNAEDRIAALTRLAAEVRSGEMPPKPYARIHDAALNDDERQKITTWARAERKRLRTETSTQKETQTP
jgi:hypothetical protein